MVLVVSLLQLRPTASELLKHQFFKKAKDKDYIKEAVFPLFPDMKQRAKKVRTGTHMGTHTHAHTHAHTHICTHAHTHINHCVCVYRCVRSKGQVGGCT